MSDVYFMLPSRTIFSMQIIEWLMGLIFRELNYKIRELSSKQFKEHEERGYYYL